MSPIYQTTAFAAAGRSGTACLEDGSLSLDLSVPGSGKPGANPEQLFALGYAACFDNAVKLIARRLKLPLDSSETRADVALVQDGAAYRLSVTIGLRTSGLTQAQAQQLLDAAHQTCPYSNALRGNADVAVALIN